MVMIQRQNAGPLRKYWWVLLVLLIGAGGYLTMPMFTGGGDDAARPDRKEASEQSLDSLDAASNPAGAPGGPMNLSMEGTGAYARKKGDESTMASSLYEAPRGPGGAGGAPVSGDAAADGKTAGAASSLADALRKVAKSGDKDGKGWGSEAPRTGFSRPQAKFGAMGSSASGGLGGAGSSAGLSVSAFAGGRPNTAGEATLGAAAGGGPFTQGRIVRGTNQSLNALKGVDQMTSRAAGAGGADLAKSFGNQGFDAAGAKAGNVSVGGGAALGAGGVYGNMDGVPENLKLDDPKLQKKELTPPEVKQTEEVKDPQQEMEQKMMMMLVQAAIGGLLGPVFGGIGSAMAGAFGGGSQGGGYYNSSGQLVYQNSTWIRAQDKP